MISEGAAASDDLQDSWARFHRRWSRLKPPLRADQAVVDAITTLLGERSARTLLLGVTPDLAPIGDDLTAVDWSAQMIAWIWPGDGPARRALLGDWREMPTGERRFSAVIGDGSLNCLALADYPGVFDQLMRVLEPGGRIAVRMYLTPDVGETLAEVRGAVMAGEIKGFHAFKWRLAMALAAEQGRPDTPVAEILAAFDQTFPDRAGLAQATGWDLAEIAEIDDYAGSRTVFSFPTRGQVLARMPAAFEGARFAPAGAYELAERCPILFATHAA